MSVKRWTTSEVACCLSGDWIESADYDALQARCAEWEAATVAYAEVYAALAARLKRLEADMDEIKAVAEDYYSGPEDKLWGGILSLCQRCS